jgi:arsenite methyltransferase
MSNSVTSTGHAFSQTSWLDQHYESARAEYEDSLRSVGIQPGWSVLDAGSGAGGFLPLISELVGASGHVSAVDLAPENVAQIESLVRAEAFRSPVQASVASVLALPFADGSFDCVWSANVAQYFTAQQFDQSVAEFKRVLKPRGILAIKDQDASIFQLAPIDADVVSRLWHARRSAAERGVPGPWTGVLGPWSSIANPSRLRAAGLNIIDRKGWFVERWAPLGPATRGLVDDALKRWAKLAEELPLSETDRVIWQGVGSNPERIINDPDFCFREAFVLTVAQV